MPFNYAVQRDRWPWYGVLAASKSPELAEDATVLSELRDRLRRAVEQEQFEEAARLRDQIKVME